MNSSSTEHLPPVNVPLLLGVLGAVLLGEGVMLFISSNWRAIPMGAKLVLIFGNVLGSYLLAYRMKFAARPRSGFASALFLKGAIGYGAGIFLIAQIYNFHADWRAGLIYWFVGALPLAYAVDSRPVLALSLGTLVLWTISKFDYFGREVFLLLPWLGGLLVLAAVVHWARLFPRFGGTYFMTGACLILIPTLFLSWGNVARGWVGFEWSAEFQSLAVALAGVYVILLVATALVLRTGGDRALRLLVLFLPIALLPTIFLASKPSREAVGDGFLLLVNLLLFAECLGLIFLGAAGRTRAVVKLGGTVLVLLTVCRFFDGYWYYLPRSVVFLLLGLSLMVAAFLWERGRRKTAEAES